MSFAKTEIEKIAWLARLSLAEEDIPGYSKDLTNILSLVEQMNTIDTTTVEPLAHPLELKARLREDTITEPDERDHFQEIAPLVENGYYLVPKVIE